MGLEILNYNSEERILEGRRSLESLYTSYFKLLDYNWNLRLSYYEGEYPVWCFTSPTKGRANWLISGIHGEEPAGPNAIAESVKFLGELGRVQPLVVYPMCNPLAYVKDWRYFNEPRDKDKGLSVGDAIHYLKRKPPTSVYAKELTAHVLKTTKTYPPNLVIDLHEDEDITAPYFYFYGSDMTIPKWGIAIAESRGFVIQKSGETDRGEKIVDGMVLNSEDDSLDELLWASAILKKGMWMPGPRARAVLVVETPVAAPLETRVQAHKDIIETLL